MTTFIAAVGFNENWWHILWSDFFVRAELVGTIVALLCGVVGYFVLIRREVFAAHALGHIGFPGATGAVLLGVSPSVGLGAFSVLGAILIGLLGAHAREREVATSVTLATSTGAGFLFASLASSRTSTVTSVLFGSLLSVTQTQILWFSVIALSVAVALGAMSRPLLAASLNLKVAVARGVPVRALTVAFMVLLAITTTMAVQVIGTLLIFALMVTPAAAALNLTARPAAAAAISCAFALLAVWGGLVLSAIFNLPPSVPIVGTATLCWLCSLVGRSQR